MTDRREGGETGEFSVQINNRLINNAAGKWERFNRENKFRHIVISFHRPTSLG